MRAASGNTTGRARAGRTIDDRLDRLESEREIHALVPHFSLVTRTLVDAVAGAGGEIYAWTVNAAGELARLAALGVTGVITNDPRLFSVIEQADAL